MKATSTPRLRGKVPADVDIYLFVSYLPFKLDKLIFFSGRTGANPESKHPVRLAVVEIVGDCSFLHG